MSRSKRMRSILSRVFTVVNLAAGLAILPVFAQPVTLNSKQLDQLVGRIALYPDPLLAQVMTASTYWGEIPDAARWAASPEPYRWRGSLHLPEPGKRLQLVGGLRVCSTQSHCGSIGPATSPLKTR